MVNDAFVSHGIFELIASVITFLGILLAVDNRIVSNYDDILKEYSERKKTLTDAIQREIIDGFSPQVEESIQSNHYEISELRIKRDDFKFFHFAYSIFGILFILGYGIALLTNEFEYGFFWTFAIMLIGVSPTLIYLISHVRKIRKTMKYLSITRQVFEDISNDVDEHDSQFNSSIRNNA